MRSVCVLALVLVAGCYEAPVEPDGRDGLIVGVEGGTLDLGDGLVLAVPPGAVDQPIRVTASLAPTVSVRDAIGPVWLLGPEGQTFRRPVTLNLPITAQPAGDVFVAWAPRGSNRFERISAHRTSSGVAAEVTHFSLYAPGSSAPDAGEPIDSGFVEDAGNTVVDDAPHHPPSGGGLHWPDGGTVACAPYSDAGFCRLLYAWTPPGAWQYVYGTDHYGAERLCDGQYNSTVWQRLICADGTCHCEQTDDAHLKFDFPAPATPTNVADVRSLFECQCGFGHIADPPLICGSGEWHSPATSEEPLSRGVGQACELADGGIDGRTCQFGVCLNGPQGQTCTAFCPGNRCPCGFACRDLGPNAGTGYICEPGFP